MKPPKVCYYLLFRNDTSQSLNNTFLIIDLNEPTDTTKLLPPEERTSQTSTANSNNFWSWLDNVKQKSAELVDAAKKNLQEFSSKVEEKSNTFAQVVQTESKSLVQEAKLSIGEIMESEVVKVHPLHPTYQFEEICSN